MRGISCNVASLSTTSPSLEVFIFAEVLYLGVLSGAGRNGIEELLKLQTLKNQSRVRLNKKL